MSRLGIGIVDYGVGNHTSVWRTLYALGYRCKISSRPEELLAQDFLVLPGVGAFPPAMQALLGSGLDKTLRTWVSQGKPLLGICLGMQLLADSSDEFGHTKGLGLIPGAVVELGLSRSHIGWNEVRLTGSDPLLDPIGGEHFYFNHSFVFSGNEAAVRAESTLGRRFPVIIRHGKVIGVQFHPEKSQEAGRRLLRSIVEGFCRA